MLPRGGPFPGPPFFTSLFSLEDAHEFRGRVRQPRAAPRNEIDVPGHIQLSHLDFLHPAALDLPLHAHARHDGDAHAHLHEPLDAFDGGHFDGHIQRRAVPREELDDAAPVRRFDDVPDEDFVTQVGDVDCRGAWLNGCLRGTTRVSSSFRISVACKLRFPGHKGNRADIEPVIQYFVRNVPENMRCTRT